MIYLRGALIAAFVLSVVGCGGDDDNDDGGSCSNLAGTYESTGCSVNPTATCVASQVGCQFSMTCDDDTKFSGTVSGNSVSFKMDGSDISCSGTAGETLTGSCTQQGASCDFEAECQSGSCTDFDGSGGTSSSGGTSGSGATSGSGGSSGSGSVDQECVNGVAALCTCAEDTEAACTEDDLAAFYQGCVENDEGADILRCFATYVEEETINCADAAAACAPEE